MLHLLHGFGGVFRLFDYVTFRAAMAGFTALILGFMIAPRVLSALRHLRQPERDKRLMGELAREGGKVPTMGGLLILIPALVSSLLWARCDNNSYVPAALIVYLGMSAVGWADDYLKVVKKNSDGLSSRKKLLGQALSAGAAFALLMAFPESRAKMCEVWAPFVKNPVVAAGDAKAIRAELMQNSEVWSEAAPAAREVMVAAREPILDSSSIPLAVVVIGSAAFFALVTVGSSNAVNLTDGLDGLAVGCVITTALTFGVAAYLAGHREFADYLLISPVRGAGELGVVCAAMLGGAFVFLWYNAAPAEVYMGDVGALGLGGLIGAIAFMINMPFLLVIVGGVFVVEALSVMIQVAYFKRTGGRRVFLMTPIHHHFQKTGWPVTKIVTRFWLLSLLCAIVGLMTLKLR